MESPDPDGMERMRNVIDISFQHEGARDKKALNALRAHPELGAGAHCVYVYSLAELALPYPNGAGTAIYIGEVCRLNEPSGARFAGHISKSPAEGNNFTTNHTLTAYYYAGHKLRLRVFRLDTCATPTDRKLQEQRLIAAHVKRFGAQPIGQGTTGQTYTPKTISTLAPTHEEDAFVSMTVSSSSMPSNGSEESGVSAQENTSLPTALSQ